MTINWANISGGSAPDDAVHVNVASPEALLDDIDARLERGDGFSVATLNLDHVVKIKTLASFRKAYSLQSHVTADGNPIVWFSRLAGQGNLQLTTGSDLIVPMARLAARHGKPIGLFGSTSEALDAAAAALQAQIPDLSVAAKLAPAMGFDPNSDAALQMIDKMADAGVIVCFLALGAPKQEVLAARMAARHPHMGMLSIGAGLDFLAGTQTRAPAWVRKFAVEWVWRLVTKPGRFAVRYLGCIAILPHLLLTALRARASQPRG